MHVFGKVVFRLTFCDINLFPQKVLPRNTRLFPKITHQQKKMYSRFSASTLQTGSDIFNFNNYDCIGFDLDNTICNYKLLNMVTMEYDILSKFLVERKGYDPEYILRPFHDNIDFLQRGLIMDFGRGNILRVGSDGYIEKAAHGTKLLSDKEISQCYGFLREWNLTTQYVNDLLVAWNGPLEKELRTCLDYFDMPSALCFANCVDALDKNGKSPDQYNIWPDILEGLTEMFGRENFSPGKGGFFPNLKANPEKFINKCSDSVLSWLKEAKKHKKTFLITGSHVDFATFTARNCMGEDWKDYFDVVVFYARKPGFFTANRPFLSIDGDNEGPEVQIVHDSGSHVYSQGSWRELVGLLGHLSGKEIPKVVYIGDNLVQDVYTPSKFMHCDTVALVEEMYGEGIKGTNERHPDYYVLSSKMWGSYFSTKDYYGQPMPSLWSDIIHRHSKICIPSLKAIASNPLNHDYTTFSENDFSTTGFYPGEPQGAAH